MSADSRCESQRVARDQKGYFRSPVRTLTFGVVKFLKSQERVPNIDSISKLNIHNEVKPLDRKEKKEKKKKNNNSQTVDIYISKKKNK